MRARLWIAMMVVSVSPLAAQLPNEPTISFTAGGPVVGAITPGGEVALLGVSKQYDDGTRILVREDEVLEDGNTDGTEGLELPAPPEEQSVWVAVDLTDSRYAVATPGEEPLNQVELPTEVVASDGDSHFLVMEGRWMMQVLLVRPGVGAWGGTATDGGPEDDDGIGDGFFRYSLAHLEPVGHSHPLDPPVVMSGDVLILIAPDSLETMVGKIDNPPKG